MKRPSGNLVAYVILTAGIIGAFIASYLVQQNDRDNAAGVWARSTWI